MGDRREEMERNWSWVGLNDHEQESNSSLKNFGERKQKQEFPWKHVSE